MKTVSERHFYVYAYVREDGTPYYIGKGCGGRIDAPHRIGLPPKIRRVLLLEGLSEQAAFEHEMALISAIGRKDLGTGLLRNMTEGGEGIVGISAATKEKRSASLKRVPHTLHWIRKRVQAPLVRSAAKYGIDPEQWAGLTATEKGRIRDRYRKGLRGDELSLEPSRCQRGVALELGIAFDAWCGLSLAQKNAMRQYNRRTGATGEKLLEQRLSPEQKMRAAAKRYGYGYGEWKSLPASERKRICRQPSPSLSD